jgi:hypothetical protein
MLTATSNLACFIPVLSMSSLCPNQPSSREFVCECGRRHGTSVQAEPAASTKEKVELDEQKDVDAVQEVEIKEASAAEEEEEEEDAEETNMHECAGMCASVTNVFDTATISKATLQFVRQQQQEAQQKKSTKQQ